MEKELVSWYWLFDNGEENMKYTVEIEEAPIILSDFKKINKIELAVEDFPMTEDEFRVYIHTANHFCHLASLYQGGLKVVGSDNRYLLAGYIFYHQEEKKFGFKKPLIIEKLVINPECSKIKTDPKIDLIREIRSALLSKVVARLYNSVTAEDIVFPVRISNFELSNFMKYSPFGSEMSKDGFRAFFESEYFPNGEDANVFLFHKIAGKKIVKTP